MKCFKYIRNVVFLNYFRQFKKRGQGRGQLIICIGQNVFLVFFEGQYGMEAGMWRKQQVTLYWICIQLVVLEGLEFGGISLFRSILFFLCGIQRKFDLLEWQFYFFRFICYLLLRRVREIDQYLELFFGEENIGFFCQIFYYLKRRSLLSYLMFIQNVSVIKNEVVVLSVWCYSG